jgi:hypothetical protein
MPRDHVGAGRRGDRGLARETTPGTRHRGTGRRITVAEESDTTAGDGLLTGCGREACRPSRTLPVGVDRGLSMGTGYCHSTVVDVPRTFQAGGMIGRVSFDVGGNVAGLSSSSMRTRLVRAARHPSRSSPTSARAVSPGGSGFQWAAATLHTVFPASSATSRPPVRSVMTPTGRPNVSLVAGSGLKPVRKSSGGPAGRPSRKGT